MVGDLTLLNRLSPSMKPPFRKTLLCTLAVVATGTAHGDDETRTPRLQLPCLAELVAHARSGEGPLAFEEAFFDGPYARATGDDLIERGYAYLHGFWNTAAERSFREAYQRDHESVEALIGLALIIVPLQLGSPSVAFPRAAALSQWTWPILCFSSHSPRSAAT